MRCAPQDPASKLQAPAQAEEVSAPLLRAMCALKKARADAGPMAVWLAGHGSCNATELYGISKYALSLRLACEKQLTQAMDVVRWYAKIGLPTHHPDVFEAVRGWLDSTLCALWSRAKTQKLGWGQYADLYKDALNLIIPRDDLNLILGCGHNYNSIKDTLHKVVGSSKTGHALFGFMLLQVLSSQVSDLIAEDVAAFRVAR